MDMTGVYACLFEAVYDVTTVPSHLKAGSPPPLELSFWLFPTFLYHVKEESQTNLLMKTA